MAALQYVDEPGYNALLIRDTYQNLNKPEGLTTRAHEWLRPWRREIKWEEKHARFVFLKSGATLSFGYLDGPRDHFNYDSAAYQFVGIDECVNIRQHQALFMFNRLRRTKKIQHIPIRFRCASNPPLFEQLERGEWVKLRYVDSETRGERVFIPAKIEDNIHLDAEQYINQSLSQLDPISYRQRRHGDWEIQAGDRFFNVDMIKILDINDCPVGVAKDIVRRWDMAATEERKKSKDASDSGPAYTTGSKCFVSNGTFYVMDVHRGRWLPGMADKEILQTAQLDGRGVRIVAEQEPGSSGIRDMSHLRNHLRGFSFQGKPSTGSKIVRARPLSSWVNQGYVVFVRGEWNEAAIKELRFFPDGKFKDIVDTLSGAYSDLSPNLYRPDSAVITLPSVGTSYDDIGGMIND